MVQGGGARWPCADDGLPARRSFESGSAGARIGWPAGQGGRQHLRQPYPVCPFPRAALSPLSAQKQLPVNLRAYFSTHQHRALQNRSIGFVKRTPGWQFQPNELLCWLTFLMGVSESREERILREACKWPSVDRAAFLPDACGADDALRHGLEARSATPGLEETVEPGQA